MSLPASATLTTDDIQMVKAMVFQDQGIPSLQLAGVDRFRGTDTIRPMVDPDKATRMLALSGRLSRAVRIYARNVAGLGWRVEPRRPEEQLGPRAKIRYQREREDLERLLERPNAEQSLSEILECYAIDEQSTGTGYLEVVRNEGGTIGAIYQAPSKTVRISTVKAPSGGQLFIQRRSAGAPPRWFAPFGETSGVSPETGKVTGGSRRASEIIRSKIYTPDDEWYGAPRFMPAAPSILSTRLGQQWNISFLRNSAHMPYAVIVEGGNLNAKSTSLIRDFIDREGKGVSNAGRVLLLEPNLENVPPEHQKNVRIKLEKLAVGLTDDGSFLKLRQADETAVREVMGLPEILLGTFTDANKSNAIIALRVTIQQEIEPEIQRKEHMLNNTIVRDMGATIARVRLIRPRVLDSLQEANLTTKMLVGLSMNELRAIASRLLGVHLPPIEGHMGDIPRGFFQDVRMLMQAEELEARIVEKVRQIGDGINKPIPEVDGSVDSGESGVALLGAEFDNVVNLLEGNNR